MLCKLIGDFIFDKMKPHYYNIHLNNNAYRYLANYNLLTPEQTSVVHGKFKVFFSQVQNTVGFI